MTKNNIENKNISVYIHIPFCEKRCNYCAFFSSILDNSWQDKYIDALVKELTSLADLYKDRTISTCYLGGGTPSLLTLENINKITNCLHKNFNCKIEEFTIEINPHSSKNIANYKDFGIDRVSIGIQSFDDRILNKIGRLHSADDALNTLKMASKYYDKISGDIILGIEDNQDITGDCQKIMDYANHISSYMLKVEEGTILYKQVSDNLVTVATEDNTIRQYNELYNYCQNNGYNRYEVSNFALDKYQSKHNLHYWDMSNYLGVGAGAYSYVDGKRYHNIDNIPKYIDGSDIIYDRQYSLDDELEEFIMLALRTQKGLLFEKFYDFFGFNFEERYKENLIKILPYINKDKNSISIKNEFVLVQNTIISDLI